MLLFLLRGSPRAVLLRAFSLILCIAFADWLIQGNIPLGFLYLFPMLLFGTVLNRWQLAGVAALCTLLTEVFDIFDWYLEAGVPRDILIFSAFLGMGLFVYETVRSRQISLLHLKQIETEVEARREAEEQLKVLVESSPAAIFTVNSEGRVLLANSAADSLFGLPPGKLLGQLIWKYLPVLVSVPAWENHPQLFRTVMQCRGHRENGEVFQADIWFSTYRTSVGPRLAAMVADTSEDLRTQEEWSLQRLLTASRILVGAVSHEVRNVCGAIALVHANLARSGALAQNKDFEALGTLILALEKIASMDLRQTANQTSSLDLPALLEELRIVIEPSLREEEVEVQWQIEPNLPRVWADWHNLIQVFLNLTQNSVRAMQKSALRRLTVTARRENQIVVVRVEDTGCGIANPERLFHPFQPGAQATGLGLYLSRAFMRSFRGDLRYEPRREPGACFAVELSVFVGREEAQAYGAEHSDFAAGRSQLVS